MPLSPKQIGAIIAKRNATKAAAPETPAPAKTRSEAQLRAIRGYYARRARSQAAQAA